MPLQYPQAFKLNVAQIDTLNLQVPELETVLASFRGQIRRVHYLLDFPIRMYHFGAMWWGAHLHARLDVLGKINPTNEVAEANKEAVYSKQLDYFKQWTGRNVTEEESREHLEVAAWQVDLFGVDKPEFAIGAHATLAVAILEIQTTFEVLVKDLWIKAANLRPRKIAMKAAKETKGPRGPEGGKSIPISFLERNDFDLSAVMGDVLVESEKFEFDSLNAIKKSYVCAFDESSMQLFFDDQSYTQLRWLESLRNLLAHRAGKVDQRFLDEMQGHQLFGTLPLNTDVPISGVTVSTFANWVIACCIGLIEFVDKWLIANPDK